MRGDVTVRSPLLRVEHAFDATVRHDRQETKRFGDVTGGMQCISWTFEEADGFSLSRRELKTERPS